MPRPPTRPGGTARCCWRGQGRPVGAGGAVLPSVSPASPRTRSTAPCSAATPTSSKPTASGTTAAVSCATNALSCAPCSPRPLTAARIRGSRCAGSRRCPCGPVAQGQELTPSPERPARREELHRRTGASAPLLLRAQLRASAYRLRRRRERAHTLVTILVDRRPGGGVPAHHHRPPGPAAGLAEVRTGGDEAHGHRFGPQRCVAPLFRRRRAGEPGAPHPRSCVLLSAFCCFCADVGRQMASPLHSHALS